MKDFVLGGLVRVEDFFFREECINDIWDSIRKDNILLLAPRRMGKTSVMYHLLDRPRDGYLPVHFNVEMIDTPGDFFLQIVDALNNHQHDFFVRNIIKAWQFLGEIWGRLEGVAISEFKVTLRKADDWQANWKQRGNELIDAINISDRKILFIIDELPDMILAMEKENTEQTISFLHFFRAIRMHNTKVRWLIGGSVNIRGTLQRMGQSKLINDLNTMFLPPFSETEVKNFVEQMFFERAVQFEADSIERMLILLGKPVTLYLQIFTKELYKYYKNMKTKITEEVVDIVFNEALLGEIARDKLQHNFDRINSYYPETEKEPAHKILAEISRNHKPTSIRQVKQLYKQIRSEKMDKPDDYELENDFDQLMYYLQTDFYVEEVEDGKIDFTSRLLKLWWRKYYG